MTTVWCVLAAAVAVLAGWTGLGLLVAIVIGRSIRHAEQDRKPPHDPPLILLISPP